MNCVNHPDRDAVETCANCGGGICEFCKTLVEGKLYCPPCVEQVFTQAAARPAEPPADPPVEQPAAVADTLGLELLASTPAEGGQAGQPSWAIEEAGVSWGGVLVLVVALGCAVAAMVGVFLPWLSASFLGFTFSISGWEATQWSDVIGGTIIEPYLVLAGSGIMMLCILPAIIVSIGGREAEDTVKRLAGVAAFGAGMVIAAMIWTIIDMHSDDVGEFIGSGVYVSLVTAIVALIALLIKSKL